MTEPTEQASTPLRTWRPMAAWTGGIAAVIAGAAVLLSAYLVGQMEAPLDTSFPWVIRHHWGTVWAVAGAVAVITFLVVFIKLTFRGSAPKKIRDQEETAKAEEPPK